MKVVKQGGVVGFNEEILIAGKIAIYKDKKSGVEAGIKLSDDKVKIIEDFLKKEEREIKIIGEPYPDCIVYEIFFKTNGKIKKIIYYPGPQSIDTEIETVIKFINEIIEEAISQGEQK